MLFYLIFTIASPSFDSKGIAYDGTNEATSAQKVIGLDSKHSQGSAYSRVRKVDREVQGKSESQEPSGLDGALKGLCRQICSTVDPKI